MIEAHGPLWTSQKAANSRVHLTLFLSFYLASHAGSVCVSSQVCLTYRATKICSLSPFSASLSTGLAQPATPSCRQSSQLAERGRHWSGPYPPHLPTCRLLPVLMALTGAILNHFISGTTFSLLELSCIVFPQSSLQMTLQA